jgi:antitoxin ParD1/3/4
MCQKVKNLFDKTQAIPEVQQLTNEDITAEIQAYHGGI